MVIHSNAMELKLAVHFLKLVRQQPWMIQEVLIEALGPPCALSILWTQQWIWFSLWHLHKEELLVKAKDYGIACVGITDYFLINSYKRLIELINDDSRLNALLNPPYADYAKQLLVLPNIEFRSSTIVRHVDIEGKPRQESQFSHPFLRLSSDGNDWRGFSSRAKVLSRWCPCHSRWKMASHSPQLGSTWQ